jgi:CRISPR-associated endonuclease/helicase Cas3
MELLAHSENATGATQSLADHLDGVADLARCFALPYGGGEAAYAAGLTHDLGKASLAFQEYVRGLVEAKRGPDHSSAGALVAQSINDVAAWVAAAHHSGLPGRKELRERLRTKSELRAALDSDEAARELVAKATAASATLPNLADPASMEFFIRMVFSALVDADALDTERHFSPTNAATRAVRTDLKSLRERFDASQSRMLEVADTPVNAIRGSIYTAVMGQSEHRPGFFTLTVPTGGGKTLTALGFALAHALRHGQRRIIVAIPYTSIIEQTCRVYRDVLGRDSVIEHHSAMPADRDDGSDSLSRQVLATDNWDAPLVVTTTVQLFESLFSNRPGRCRKLHNVAGAVVILDEVQTLPTELLAPIVAVLRELVANYGVSVVLCTATQPALQSLALDGGIPAATELAPDPPRLFAMMARVRYSLPFRSQQWSWEEVAQFMRSRTQVLCILNTKRDALALLDALDDPEALHLSTLLCGCHRAAVLRRVAERLTSGQPCRLVSTQVVEAGVDMDFPVVLRALGPLDRVVQAAGRCNREGRLPYGEMVVFDPSEGSRPPGSYRTGTDIARNMLLDNVADPADPDTFSAYYRLLFKSAETDSKDIRGSRIRLDFPTTAQRFRIIPDDSVPVIVTALPAWAVDDERDARDPIPLAEQALAGMVTRGMFRDLQPFLVSLRRSEYARVRDQGLVQECLPDALGVWRGAYDPVRGLGDGHADPERLVVI